MPVSFYLGLVLVVLTFFELLRDHDDEWKSLKEAVGKDRNKHINKLAFMWTAFAVSLAMTGFGAWEYISDKKEGEQIKAALDPLNKPIATASAFAKLIISQNPRPWNLFNPSPEEEGAEWRASISFLEGTNVNSNVLLRVVASNASGWNMGSTTNREWRIHFHEEQFDFIKRDRNDVFVKRFDGVNALFLSMPFETNMVVESGTVVLNVNNLIWRFDIPRQKPKWGIITMTRSKDKNGDFKSSILRVPIIDWAVPPRFTNRWYDGM